MTAFARGALAAEISWTYVEARWALRDDNLPRAVERLRDRRLRPGSPLDVADAVRLGRAAGRVLTPLPFDAKCLVRSLVVSSLLARRATPTSLVIGVRPGDEFSAHAWVELDGCPILPDGEAGYQRLAVL